MNRLLPLLALAGCGFVSESWYEDNVLDRDGDGAIDIRFTGGTDCNDDDPDIRDCDQDNDGFLSAAAGGTDCNDNDNAVHPDQRERCNGIDDDCDGDIDDEDGDTPVDTQFYYLDADNDGFGDRAQNVRFCTPPVGYIEDDSDCDDQNASIHPDATEVCNDVDTNCDGLPRGDAEGQDPYFGDDDGDGYGAGPVAGVACTDLDPPIGFAFTNTDCNDDVASINPGVAEDFGGLDLDCNSDNELDFDGDGSPVDQDCDDNDATRFPGAAELCDGIDNDCDQQLDDVDTILPGVFVYYLDFDQDGVAGADERRLSCDDTAPSDTFLPAPARFDCDDTRDDVYPGNPEVCDGLDNNCDLVVDENVASAPSYYRDQDGDGFGDPNNVRANQCVAPLGYVRDQQDCDDQDDSVFPGALEVCGDDVVQDCSSGNTDPYDCDNDGTQGDYLGSPGGTDCDDENPSVSPFADEVCDGLDNDCDGLTDDEDDDIDIDSYFVTLFVDDDQDGFGTVSTVLNDGTCNVPANATALAGDCDDDDPLQNPNAVELCNGEDDDCDGATDNNAVDAPELYADADADGFVDLDVRRVSQCAIGDGFFLATEDDCDDNDSDIRPDADEICNLRDDDCDGLFDDQDSNVTGNIWYDNQDGDSFGNSNIVFEQCSQPPMTLPVGGDCDDQVATIGADQIWYADADADGFGDLDAQIASCAPVAGHVTNGLDCDDQVASISPASVEVCDGVDNDCDGATDDADDIIANAPVWFPDGDADGWGDPALFIEACQRPDRHTFISGDCDDQDPTRSPGLPEVCDGVDNDCDSLVDDDDSSVSGGQRWGRDLDEDGQGSQADVVSACIQPDQFVPSTTDCDDENPTVGLGFTETCDQRDNDCDGLVDIGDPDVQTSRFYTDADQDGLGDPSEFVDECTAPPLAVLNGDDCDDTEALIGSDRTWFVDGDGDGFGSQTEVQACSRPANAVANNTDCDDTDPAVNPSAVEVCNGVDDDCDNDTDQLDSSVVGASTFYADVDGDGWGDAAQPTLACQQPADHSPFSGDCDDNNITVAPGAAEVCDGIDNDCDIAIDDDDDFVVGAPLWGLDSDADGFGSTGNSVLSCDIPELPGNWAQSTTDCDDTDPTAYPGAIEVCDGADNDCDFQVDDQDPQRVIDRYIDLDGDGLFGTLAENCVEAIQDGVTQPPTSAFDCDDTDPLTFPGAPPVCDGKANDCSGEVDPQDLDEDEDGFLACEDCDDSDDDVYPGRTELCDAVDHDCDGSETANAADALTWSPDTDGDGRGTDDSLFWQVACDAPDVGFVLDTSDCNDDNNQVALGFPELCDTVDNDCDGLVDAADADLAAPRRFADADGDNLGAGDSFLSCDSTLPIQDGDCNDASARVQSEGQRFTVLPGSDFAGLLTEVCDDSVVELTSGLYRPGSVTVSRSVLLRGIGSSTQIDGSFFVSGDMTVETADMTLDGLQIEPTGRLHLDRTRLTISGSSIAVQGVVDTMDSQLIAISDASMMTLQNGTVLGLRTTFTGQSGVLFDGTPNTIDLTDVIFQDTGPEGALTLSSGVVGINGLIMHGSNMPLLTGAIDSAVLSNIDASSSDIPYWLDASGNITWTDSTLRLDSVQGAARFGDGLINLSDLDLFVEDVSLAGFDIRQNADTNIVELTLGMTSSVNTATGIISGSPTNLTSSTVATDNTPVASNQVTARDSVLMGSRNCTLASKINVYGMSNTCGTVVDPSALQTFSPTLTTHLWDLHVSPFSGAINSGAGAGLQSDWYDDTDMDDLADGWELHHFGSLIFGSTTDNDSDWLPNGEEARRGTSPLLPDTDNDGQTDTGDPDPLSP